MTLDDSFFCWLTTGEPPPTLESFLLEPSVLWAQYGREILDAWILAHPGSRPWGWWQFAAPEPRLRLGGRGTPAHVALPALVPQFTYGVPVDWIGRSTIASCRSLKIKLKAQAFSEKNPPTFEAQGAYLKRHGLLGAHEAELADFASEILPRQYWPD